MTRTDDIAIASARLQEIREGCRELEACYSSELSAVHPRYRDAARNLVHYLALRGTDICDLQDILANLGLSSLDRAERNVMASIGAVRSALVALERNHDDSPDPEAGALHLKNPGAVSNKEAILGRTPHSRDVSIMITLPREAAMDPSVAKRMLAAGMNVARINCAHDDESIWARMVRNVRAAGGELGVECKIVMDLAGPKIRTGELQPGPRVFHIRPRRDPMGRIIAPRRVRLIPDDTSWHGKKIAVLPVPGKCIDYAHEGDEIRFKDTRGKKRKFTVVKKDKKGLVLEIYKGAYVATGTKLRLLRKAEGEELTYRIGELPAVEQPILLRKGDRLILDRSPIPGAPATENDKGEIIEPAHISCKQPEAFDFVSAGQRISMNDGKITGLIEAVLDDRLVVTITRAKPTGSRLRGDQGINFPDSDLRLPALTVSDKEDLRFIVENADAVCQSFVKTPDDITALQEELQAAHAEHLGLVVKIETKKGFRNLPRLLLTAMRSYPVAVMIARGDLAVEAGWERLAELQEEILWFCEAAQVPVIWATQVLERTTKSGQPSRAEISDAALSQRADCVMLNKGPHIIKAIKMLDNILRRMQSHQFKKMPRMRKLQFAAD